MWRYEVKYILETHQWLAIEKLLIEHPASFSTLYPDRQINNIYYDTSDLQMCRDNLAGISERSKLRVRWYGDNNIITKPVLEKKIKNNSLGRKENKKLDFSDYKDINEWINKEYLSIGAVHPILHNQYVRSYYLNLEGNFRLTIDRGVQYQKADSLHFENDNLAIRDDRIIMEIKFDQKDLKRETEITNFIPFRPSKHSKYVTGVLACYS